LIYIFSKKKSNINLNKKSDTVVIIGNSSNIKSYKYGGKINKMDIVVRFNLLSIDGYEEYLGNKTTIRCVSDTIVRNEMSKLKNFKNEKIYVVIPWVGRYNKVANEIKLKMEENNFKFYIIPNKYVNVNQPRKKWLSTGAIATRFFISKYKKVFVHGFDHFEENGKQLHYNNDNIKRSLANAHHDHNFEKTLFANWKSQKFIESL
jgi:hypothetical protein